MKTKSALTNFFSLLLPFTFAALIFSALFMGCEKTVEKIVTVTDTVEVEITVEIISVDSVIALGDPVDVGETLSLTVTTTASSEAGTLEYNWFAEAGTFASATGVSVDWVAPDDIGSYKISVHVSDGTYIGIGTRVVGVGMYAPDSSTYYVGAAACSVCHSSTFLPQYTQWSETAHADAWVDLQEGGHAASYCEPCHTVGHNGLADQATGDSGWDDSRVGIFTAVQCENCHGPGSAHIDPASDKAATIDISFDAAVCGDCHSGDHNPTFDVEWTNSPHNFDASTAYATGNSSCQGCHEGVAAAIRLSGDMSTFYGSGAITGRPTVEEQELRPIVCATCHDPHDATNDHQMRTVADVVLVTANGVTNPVITEGGTGKLCMQCHHARRGPDSQVLEGYGHFGPHANPQADMLAGKSAYHAVAPETFTWAQPSHLYVENSCRTCHVNMIPYGELFPDKAVTGHTFLPTVQACQRCHGVITDFDDIMALDDFDGDGTVEGVQSEVTGLMHLLEAALIDSFIVLGADTSATSTNWDDLAHALGDTLFHVSDTDSVIVPELWRASGYNLVFLEDDKSSGVHNPDYAVQLLQQSYLHLTGSDVPAATIHRGNMKVATLP